MKPILTLADLLLMANMDVKDAIEYAKDKGVDISDDYDEIEELIAKQSYEIFSYSKLSLLQSLLDIAKESETIEDVKSRFTEQSNTDGWDTSNPSASERAAVINGYDGFSYSQRRTEKNFSYYMYLSVIDGTTTEGCKVLNKKVFEYSDSNAIKYLYPPRHYGCRAMHLALKKYTGTKSKAITYKQYWAEEPFVKVGKGYSFKPDAKDFDETLYKSYENS